MTEYIIFSQKNRICLLSDAFRDSIYVRIIAKYEDCAITAPETRQREGARG